MERKKKKATNKTNKQKQKQKIELAKHLHTTTLFGRLFRHDCVPMKEGKDVTLEEIKASGFLQPFIVKHRESLDFQLPTQNLTVERMVDILGPAFKISVIDVAKQAYLFIYFLFPKK